MVNLWNQWRKTALQKGFLQDGVNDSQQYYPTQIVILWSKIKERIDELNLL